MWQLSKTWPLEGKVTSAAFYLACTDTKGDRKFQYTPILPASYKTLRKPSLALYRKLWRLQPEKQDASSHFHLFGWSIFVSLESVWFDGLYSSTGGLLLCPLPHFPSSPLLLQCSHPSAKGTAGDKPRHSAAGWEIDLPPCSSHRSASVSDVVTRSKAAAVSDRLYGTSCWPMEY